MNLLKKLTDKLFSTTTSGLYILLFALSIGIATFIENDFGTSSAQNVIFKSWWFEVLLFLFAVSLVVNVIRFRMIQQKKWAIFTFHLAIIVILLGAGVTRYFGFDGMMHIREGNTSNTFLSSETYLKFETVQDGKKYVFDEPVRFSTLGNNSFKSSYLIGNSKLDVEVLGFIPNPGQMLIEDENGKPIIKIVMGGMNGREEYFLKYREPLNLRGTLFNFDEAEKQQAVNIRYENGGLFIKSNEALTQTFMATQQRDTLIPGEYHPLMMRSLYAGGRLSFVMADFRPKGKIDIASSSEKMTSTSMGAIHIKLTFDDYAEHFYVYGAMGMEGTPQVVNMGTSSFSVSYGAKKVLLPFSIKLNKFIMDRYPGTNSASSYASEITLLDPQNNINRDQRIYMNNILNYGGYRFFQSSYDQDELGTYLSVNNDAWGTWISYIGYALLTLGMAFTFFSSKSRFQQLAKNIKKLQQAGPATAAIIVVGLLTFSTTVLYASTATQPGKVVDPDHAARFGRLVVQDYNGRMKPMNTFANEILRKLSRKELYQGLKAEQVILGMAVNLPDWYGEPIIRLGKNEEIKSLLQVSDVMIAYRDFFDMQGAYKLKDLVRNAYNMSQRDRGTLEKELLKLDEKVNICSMVFSGRFMRLFPVPANETHAWQTPAEVGLHHAGHNHGSEEDKAFATNFYPQYTAELRHAIDHNNWTIPNKMIAELQLYQQRTGGEIYPSDNKIQSELFLNKLNVFDRLGKVYGLLALAFLTLLFISVFNHKTNLKWPFHITFGILTFSFFMHLLGLGLRWYVSGRAPWSNGYESMIYIAFTTILAGLIFSRKSYGGLAATTVLAATILMVAGLSWLDPEITPLVPVLKSYWLTIHVSMEAGSYGFLMLGAIIGVLNLILMIFRNKKNNENISRIIKEMTYISEMTLIGGLFMVSIGTYLGGVWANESWGRYWGWDAKETWALVTILVYAFILHMRFIPGMRSTYAFNVASLFGWASVMMTYFGVNYYLSGLHSYAAGDPVPIPPFVYYTVFILISICLLAYWRNYQFDKANLQNTKLAKPVGI